jgi:hypothetical protein
VVIRGSLLYGKCVLDISSFSLRSTFDLVTFFDLSFNGMKLHIRECIQKFPDWQLGARTANDTALCHEVQLYRYFMSQSGEFCRHNPFLTNFYCWKRIFFYQLSPETFGYTLVGLTVTGRNSPIPVTFRILSLSV